MNRFQFVFTVIFFFFDKWRSLRLRWWKSNIFFCSAVDCSSDHVVSHRRTPAPRHNPLNQITWWIQISILFCRRRRILGTTAIIQTTVSERNFPDRRSTTLKWWERSQPNTTIPMSEFFCCWRPQHSINGKWHKRNSHLQFTNAQDVVYGVKNQADSRGINVNREEAQLASAGNKRNIWGILLVSLNLFIHFVPQQITPNPNLLTSLFSSLQFNQNSIFNPMLDMGSTRALVLLVSVSCVHEITINFDLQWIIVHRVRHEPHRKLKCISWWKSLRSRVNFPT